MDIVSKVVHRFRLRASGFRFADEGEALPSTAMVAKTRSLIREMRSLLVKAQLGPLLGSFDRALRRYDGMPTVGTERDVQFHVLLGIKELEKAAPDAKALGGTIERIESLLAG
jgi:hypothetical protein